MIRQSIRARSTLVVMLVAAAFAACASNPNTGRRCEHGPVAVSARVGGVRAWRLRSCGVAVRAGRQRGTGRVRPGGSHALARHRRRRRGRGQLLPRSERPDRRRLARGRLRARRGHRNVSRRMDAQQRWRVRSRVVEYVRCGGRGDTGRRMHADRSVRLPVHSVRGPRRGSSRRDDRSRARRCRCADRGRHAGASVSAHHRWPLARGRGRMGARRRGDVHRRDRRDRERSRRRAMRRARHARCSCWCLRGIRERHGSRARSPRPHDRRRCGRRARRRWCHDSSLASSRGWRACLRDSRLGRGLATRRRRRRDQRSSPGRRRLERLRRRRGQRRRRAPLARCDSRSARVRRGRDRWRVFRHARRRSHSRHARGERRRDSRGDLSADGRERDGQSCRARAQRHRGCDGRRHGLGRDASRRRGSRQRAARRRLVGTRASRARRRTHRCLELRARWQSRRRCVRDRRRHEHHARRRHRASDRPGTRRPHGTRAWMRRTARR